MTQPLVYDVIPLGARWVVRIAGDSQTEVFEERSAAIDRARRLAADRAVVRVFTPTGGVELELAPPPQKRDPR